MKRACAGWLVAALIGITSDAAAQTAVTFTNDVAPILFEHCSRTMPPWKPEPGYGEFVGARRLSKP